MFDINKIQTLLEESDFNSYRDLHYRQTDETLLIYVDKGLVADRPRPGKITRNKLKHIKMLISENFHLNSEIIFLEDESRQALEKSFTAMITKEFDVINDLHISIAHQNLVNCVIEVNEIDEPFRSKIKDYLITLASDSGLKLGEVIFFTLETEYPSEIEILRAIKLHQPITVDDLKMKLHDYPNISMQWLKRALDRLRKDKFIIWQNQGNFRGCYALTNEGLKIVPAGKSYYSSDIERALALAERKWSNL